MGTVTPQEGAVSPIFPALLTHIEHVMTPIQYENARYLEMPRRFPVFTPQAHCQLRVAIDLLTLSQFYLPN
jgi:hypothetical protein